MFELGAHGVDRFEGVVLKISGTHREILLRVELWRIWRQEQQCDIVGKRKVAAAMVGGTIENQEDVLPGKFPREDIEEGLEEPCSMSA